MDRLLAALEAGEQRGQRRWLGAGALLAVGGIAGAFALREPAPRAAPAR
ncbi:MAG: hypothetical protein H6710_13320 [Myxococcales bacterium]|nr:hypothetical protein [Myxococcales bacterium]